jgi:hypothetical protein
MHIVLLTVFYSSIFPSLSIMSLVIVCFDTIIVAVLFSHKPSKGCAKIRIFNRFVFQAIHRRTFWCIVRLPDF